MCGPHRGAVALHRGVHSVSSRALNRHVTNVDMNPAYHFRRGFTTSCDNRLQPVFINLWAYIFKINCFLLDLCLSKWRYFVFYLPTAVVCVTRLNRLFFFFANWMCKHSQVALLVVIATSLSHRAPKNWNIHKTSIFVAALEYHLPEQFDSLVRSSYFCNQFLCEINCLISLARAWRPGQF